jgi:hypothetical protein
MNQAINYCHTLPRCNNNNYTLKFNYLTNPTKKELCWLSNMVLPMRLPRRLATIVIISKLYGLSARKRSINADTALLIGDESSEMDMQQYFRAF